MLLIFSLLALVLGAVLTATIIGGVLAQQVRQIAIMKAIGARPHQVAGLYFGLVSALGVVAVGIGLPLGIIAGRALVEIIGGLLNLRIDSMALPWWLYAITLVLGMGAPVIAALIPIVNAARRTVKNAIDDHGVSSAASGTSWMSLTLTRLHITDAALNLAVRNMFRRRSRLVLTIALLAGAGAMFVTSLNLKAAWESNVVQAANDRHFDLELGLQQDVLLQRVVSLISAVQGVRQVEPWNAASATVARDDGVEIVRRYPDGGHGGFALRAAPAETKLVAHTMGEGRWLRGDDSDAVVINTLARAIAFRDVRLGDSVTLSVDHRRLKLRVVGFMREPLTPGAAYVTPDTFASATDTVGRTNTLRIVLTDPERADEVSQFVVRALEHEHIGVKGVMTAKRSAAAQGGHVYILVFALGFIATMMAVVGLLGLASSLGASVIERTREFGVMRAIGAREGIVVKTVVGEGMLIALLSWIVALTLSLPLSALVGRVLASISTQELSLQLSASGALLWLCALSIGSMLVSFYPARQASQPTVRETLVHI